MHNGCAMEMCRKNGYDENGVEVSNPQTGTLVQQKKKQNVEKKTNMIAIMFCWSLDRSAALVARPYFLPFASVITINNHRCRNHVHIVETCDFAFPNRNNPPRLMDGDHHGALLSNAQHTHTCICRWFHIYPERNKYTHSYAMDEYNQRTLFITVLSVRLLMNAHFIHNFMRFLYRFDTFAPHRMLTALCFMCSSVR